MSPPQCHFLSPSQVGFPTQQSVEKSAPQKAGTSLHPEASTALGTWLVLSAPTLDNTHTAIGFPVQGDTARHHGKRSIYVVFGFGQKHSLGMILGCWDTLSSNVQSETLAPKSLPNSLSQKHLCSLDHPQGLRGCGHGGKAASGDL